MKKKGYKEGQYICIFDKKNNDKKKYFEVISVSDMPDTIVLEDLETGKLIFREYNRFCMANNVKRTRNLKVIVEVTDYWDDGFGGTKKIYYLAEYSIDYFRKIRQKKEMVVQYFEEV